MVKTRPTDVPPEEFLADVEPRQRRQDGERLLTLMTEVTGEQPVMWGPSIVGFGRRGDWMKVAFAPRRARLVLYGLLGHPGTDELLARLGPHTTGKGCLYVTRLNAVDEDVLKDLVALAASD